jgi:hypothetical protein
MPNPLHSFFSAETAATFGVLDSLSAPSRHRAPVSPALALKNTGVSELQEVVSRRSSASPIALGNVDEYDKPDISRQFITGVIKQFFLSDSVYLEKHRGREHTARRPFQYLDVREVGRTDQDPKAADTIIYCCRYGESSNDPHMQTKPDRTWNEEASASHPHRIRLAIPSSAGLQIPDAISLVNPLLMLPREYIEEGEAGAFLAVNPRNFTYTMDLYWSKIAFQQSLEQMQELGRILIEEDAVSNAVECGKAVSDIHRGSALLAKAYESVAQAAISITPQLLMSGIWGIAVLPSTNDSLTCQLGTIGWQLEDPSTEGLHQVSLKEKPQIAVTNLSITRDNLGMVSMDVEKFSVVAPSKLTWYTRLPSLN